MVLIKLNREKVSQLLHGQPSQIDCIDTTTQRVLTAVEKQQNVFQTVLSANTVITLFQGETVAKIADKISWSLN